MSGALALISLSGTPASAVRRAVARCSEVIGKLGVAAMTVAVAPIAAKPSATPSVDRLRVAGGAERSRRLMKAGLGARAFGPRGFSAARRPGSDFRVPRLLRPAGPRSSRFGENLHSVWQILPIKP